MLLIVAQRATSRAQRSAAAAFLAAGALFILVNRLAILRFDRPLNPDEAMMAAGAMRTLYGWLSWNILDLITSGPLNSAILAWPYLFGGDITMLSTRLTGLACVLGALGLWFCTVRKLTANLSAAMLALVPVTLFLAGTSYPDFVHYSSEHLPVLLLSLALFLFAASFDGDGLAKLTGSALVLGLVPFAKLQAAPIAAVIGAFVLVRAVVTRSSVGIATRVAAVIAAALAGAVVFLLPLVLSGQLDDALKSYVVQPRLRTDAWTDRIPRMIYEMPLFAALLAAYAATFAAALLAFAHARRRGAAVEMTQSWRWCATLAAVLLPVSYAAISFSGRDFIHYLLLSLPALVLVGGAAMSPIAAAGARSRPRLAVTQLGLLALFAALCLPAARHDAEWGQFWYSRGGGIYQRGKLFEAPRMLAWLRPTARDSMVCWGWAPECYLDAAVRPATREPTNENQVYPLPLRDYFRARFLRDFNAGNPDVVVDAVAPGNFPLGDPKEADISAFPALREIVERDFARVSRVDPAERCPRVYVRKSRLAALDESLIAFSAIQASAAQPGHEATAVDDGSVFETCNDNWLLPLGTPGSLTLRFHRPAPLRTVAILNTRRVARDLPVGSHRIRLSIHHAGRVVHTRDVLMRPFPFWTTVRLDNALEADAITLDILSFIGVGGGLNEVKAYRD